MLAVSSQNAPSERNRACHRPPTDAEPLLGRHRVRGRGSGGTDRDLRAGRPTTFWAGLGALRREDFLSVGGFDDIRFLDSSVEDIELGMRLTREGKRLLLDPSIQGKHLKRWTLASMIQTDLGKRGIPWV